MDARADAVAAVFALNGVFDRSRARIGEEISSLTARLVESRGRVVDALARADAEQAVDHLGYLYDKMECELHQKVVPLQRALSDVAESLRASPVCACAATRGRERACLCVVACTCTCAVCGCVCLCVFVCVCVCVCLCVTLCV